MSHTAITIPRRLPLWLSGLLLLLLSAAYSPPSIAVSEIATDLLVDLKENLRLSVDSSSSSYWYVDPELVGHRHALGIDLRKEFRNLHRDRGVLTVQAYLTRVEGLRPTPSFYADDRDTRLVYRIVNFNYTGLPRGLPNVRVGHMELPFGLEHLVDTNGTLRQYDVPQNLGLQADWGVTLNNEHELFEYEFMVGGGGNQRVGREAGSYVFAGRVGTPRAGRLVLGLSLLKNEIDGVGRERVGLDAQYRVGLQSWLAEVAFGTTDGRGMYDGLIEWNRADSSDTWQFYGQLGARGEVDAGDVIEAAAGVVYRPTRALSVSAQLEQDLFASVDATQTTLSLQLRYRTGQGYY
ncbi:MAG: hypothetical protein AAF515_13615 [Pseudomonadota bacterium]